MSSRTLQALALTTIALGAAGSLLAAELPASDTLESDAGPIEVRPIQHGTFVLEWQGRTLYVDPVGGAEAFEGQAEPDLVLITDVHGDHLNVETALAVAAADTTIVAPQAVVDQFPEESQSLLTSLANGESMEWSGVGIEAIPMYNLTPERSDFHTKGRGNGYVLTLGGKRLYISGDTEDIPEMRALEGIDAAFVCMNLPYTMTVEAAADAVLEFEPAVVYPYHYRGRPEVSDVGRFRALVSANPDIDVRLLAWY